MRRFRPNRNITEGVCLLSLTRPGHLPASLAAAGVGASSLRYLSEETIDRITSDARSVDPAWVRAVVAGIRNRRPLPPALTADAMRGLVREAHKEWVAAGLSLAAAQSRVRAGSGDIKDSALVLLVASMDEGLAAERLEHVTRVSDMFDEDSDDDLLDAQTLTDVMDDPRRMLTHASRLDLRVGLDHYHAGQMCADCVTRIDAVTAAETTGFDDEPCLTVEHDQMYSEVEAVSDAGVGCPECGQVDGCRCSSRQRSIAMREKAIRKRDSLDALIGMLDFAITRQGDGTEP